MKTKQILALAVALVALCAATVGAAPASAAFGIEAFDGSVTNADGSPTTQAGAHPYQIDTVVNFNTVGPSGHELPDESVKTVVAELPPGFIGNPTSMPQCSEFDLGGKGIDPECPDNTQVGVMELRVNFVGSVGRAQFAIYNMKVPPGTPSSFAFNAFGVVVHLYSELRSDSDYGINIVVPNINQTLPILSTKTRIWGVPADPRHDKERCAIMSEYQCFTEPASAGVPETPLLTNVTNCAAGPALTTGRADSWLHPGVFDEASFLAHDNSVPPQPVETTGCDKVPFTPSISAQPTADGAESPTGLNFVLNIPDTGILNPTGLAQSTVKKATVTLPEGMSINPSAGEGLGVCTPADLARETPTSEPGAGCPNSSKVGSVKIVSPLLEEEATGGLFIAEQDDPATTTPGAENPFDSVLALYVVAKIPDRGVIVKAAGKVVGDPKTGQLVTTFDNLPQLPFSKFTLSFREGQRSPLVSPPACGTYQVKSEFVPWSAADPDHPTAGEIATRTDPFRVTQGPGGASCATGLTRAFNPGLRAGTLNNNAGSYSPFNLRMTRNDGEQEITSFSADLPPGLTGKLAGVLSCSDADLARAAGKTGRQEAADPSCPAASQVGRTLVGAGVGGVLAYAPGKVYLAGPYHGSPLSIAAVTSATVGPFDLGTVVVREALRIDPTTATVSVDAAGSDPIPRILQGVPLHIRDVRVYMDRPDFTLNPTSCNPFAVESTLTGSGADFANPADDVAAKVREPFQAANCGNLAFKPKLSFRLKGGSHRGDYPALTATLRARPGDANIGRVAVTLPHSEFLAQEHIRTVCTRVQFAANECPAGSVYGRARATTPLLDEPLAGPVYLRSSDNPLPDLVARLNGRFDVVLSGRIDSVHESIRNTFAVVPDAPVTQFTLEMKGGKKSLLVNSRNICKSPGRADVKMVGQNGKTARLRPLVTTSCRKAGKR